MLGPVFLSTALYAQNIFGVACKHAPKTSTIKVALGGAYEDSTFLMKKLKAVE